MINFMKWVLKHPVSVFLSVLIIMLVGIVSLSQIPIEIKPEQSGQGIQIIAYWEKHPPETIQQLITQPLEDVAIQLRDVSSVESSSGIGTAIIKLSFPDHTDLKYVYVELRERLAVIREQLPEKAFLQVKPLFKDDEADEQFSGSFFDLELIGPLSLNELRYWAKEKVVPRLNGVGGVNKLELFGGSDGFVQIKLDDQKLKILGIDPRTIYSQLQLWQVNRGLGIIQKSGTNYLLNLDSRPRTINDFSQIPIRNSITLGDVSKISFGFEAPQTLYRHNFKPLVLIRIFKAQGVNALRFSNAVKEKVDEIQRELPNGVSLRIASDNSEELLDELASLGIRSSIILIVVFSVLFFLFRQWVHAILILFVIFLSIISATTFLYWTGYTINIVTLAGIALAFGMLVDNTIVVIENIHRVRSEGKSPFNSGMRGTLEVIQPITASTGTTVFVFFALLLLQDRLGAYYKPLAYVLGFSLVMSLLIAVILIPAILIRWPSLMSVKKQTYWSVKGFSLYSSLLLFLISWRKSAIVVVLLIFGATAWLFWENIDKGGFIVWSKKDEISINLRAPKGVTIEALDEIMRSFEGVIQDQGIVNETQTVIDEFGGYGHIKITFPDSINSIKPLVLKQHLISKAVNYAGVSIYISGFGIPYYNGGYRVGAMYNTILQVTGPDYYRLWEIGENIIDIAKTDIRVNEGIISPSIRNLYKSDLKEITFEGQTKKIWQDRFSIASIKSSAQPVFNKHSWQSETVINNKRYPLKIQYGEELPELVSLKRGYLQIDKNSSIPISDYFTIKKESIQPWIDKKNQQYRFTVAWQYRGPERMRKQHEQSIVQSLSLPPGYALEEQQWGFLTKKEETNLLFLLGVIGLGMFMILTALYESFSKPLVIFFTVPFALIGVFLFYIVFERDFNINGYIGLIILFGVVVNNGIVLVERINQLIRKGMSLIDAAVQGGIERIRPIMITTTTTVGGLIPLLFLPSGNTTMAKILNELSFITIGGLMGSTLLTITMIPVVYVVVANMVNKKS